MKKSLLIILTVMFSALFAQEKESLFTKLPDSLRVLESENAYVIEDKNPKAPVHLLVVSKAVIETILDVPPDLLAEMLTLAKKAAIKYNVDQTGFRIVINTNKEGGQGIRHVHIHVLGGRQMEWPPG